MPETRVVALITAKPEGVDTVRDALTALVEPSRDDAGCLEYELYVSTTDPTVFVTVERWRAREDLDAHLAQPHLAQTLSTAADSLAGAPVIHTLQLLK